jgi:hypothetical protein
VRGVVNSSARPFLTSNGSMVMETKQRNFANSFWVLPNNKGEGDKGLSVLLARMKRGKRTLMEVQTLLKERSMIEEEYGKKLAKLAKNFTPTEEIGTLRDSLCVMRTELEKSARAHLDFAQDIASKLSQPLQEFIDTQSSIRKNVIQDNVASKEFGKAATIQANSRAACVEV